MICKIRLLVANFLYNKNLFGTGKKCWAEIVAWAYGLKRWEDVSICNDCNYCGKMGIGQTTCPRVEVK